MGTPRRVGFVGAGDLAPVHVEAVQALTGVLAVGVHDIEAPRATSLADRYGLRAVATIEELVGLGVDVVHVITPPETHAELAIRAMELGCDVFIEKPMALSVEDCERVVATSRRTGRTATVDHLMLFNPQVRRAVELVRRGTIGRVVAVDVLRGGETPEYRGGTLPPFFRRAGHPFRDLGIHCLTVIEAFLGPITDVRASWQSLGGEPSIAYDEWRATVTCRDGLAQFQLSWNVRPLQHVVVVQGTSGVLTLDLFSLTTTLRRSTPAPRPVERALNSVVGSLTELAQTTAGSLAFATGRVQRLQGVRDHIAEFYRCLDTGEPMPVDLTDVVRLVRWNEHVARAAEADQEERLEALGPVLDTADVLITGAAGHLGRVLVDRLTASGRSVRVLVRRVPESTMDGVSYVVGNLGDPDDVQRAVRGAAAVIHAGATMSGDAAAFEAGTVVGTRNVVDACIEERVGQLVHISSMAVLDYGAADHGRPLDEWSGLESRPDARGDYTRAKWLAEQAVRDAVVSRGLRAAVIRPGLIFGGGIPAVTAAVARRMGGGRWVVLGDGRAKLCLVHIDDVVDAVLATVDRALVCGEVIHVVDEDLLTQDELLALVHPGASVLHVPRPVVLGLGALSDQLLSRVGRASPLAPYRVRAGTAHLDFAGVNARRLLGWVPRIGVRRGLAQESR